MAERAVIFGCEGPRLSDTEKAFFARADPWGFILFARNIEAPDQVRALTSELRASVGRDAPILIDQEGGRVQRMRAPHWREYLPAFDQMARAADPLRAMWLRNRLIAQELHDVGIDVNCAPLADIAEPGTHAVLFNRLYGSEVRTVIAAAEETAQALLAGGVLPVIKHLPGYGRASLDAHHDLARVSQPVDELMNRDFAPFVALRDIRMGMTAHIVMEALDPDQPATVSPHVIGVIRDLIGFGGLLMTDDISMEALSGSVPERSLKAWQAGCDIVLHCNGKLREMREIAEIAPQLGKDGQTRAAAALAERRPPEEIDISAALEEFEGLLKSA